MLGLCMKLLLLCLLRLYLLPFTHRSASCCGVIGPLGRDAPATLLISLLQSACSQHAISTDQHTRGSVVQRAVAGCLCYWL